MATTNIGKLSATAVLETGGFVVGSQKIQQEAKGLGARLEQIFGHVSASLRFPGFSVGFESVELASVLQFGRTLATGMMETIDKEMDLSFLNDRLGTSIEWLSLLRSHFAENSVSAEQFGQGMGRLSQAIGQANLGSVEARANFEALGLDWRRIRDQGFEESFMDIAEALSQVENRATQARIANELFGREGGQRMLRGIQEGAEGLRDAMESLRGRGGVMTEADMQNIRDANDAMDRMSTRWSQMWREATVTASPLFGMISDEMSRIIDALREMRGMPTMRQAADLARERRETAALSPAERAMQEMNFARQGILGSLGEAGEAQLQRNYEQRVAELQAIQESNDMFDAWEAMDQAIGAFQPELDRVRRSLDDAAATAGMSADQVQIYRLRQAALNDAQREAVDQLEQVIEARANEREMMAGAASLMEEGERVFQEMRTPLEVFRDRAERLNYLLESQFIDQETFDRAIEQAGNRLQGPQTPLLGSLSAGSSEVGAILQAAASPQVDVLQDIEGVLEEIRAAVLPAHDEVIRIADAIETIAES